MAQIHISCPYNTNPQDLKNVALKLKGYNHSVSWWDKGTLYNEKWLEDADAVVFILPENAWDIQLSSLPIGMAAELGKAKRLGKDLFVSYKLRGSGITQIYQVLLTDRCLSGESGTYTKIEGYKGKPKPTPCVKYDGGRVHPLDDDTDLFPPVSVGGQTFHGYAYKQIPVILLRRRH